MDKVSFEVRVSSVKLFVDFLNLLVVGFENGEM
jgi:hypothetical protein